jgi:hypothetical protein
LRFQSLTLPRVAALRRTYDQLRHHLNKHALNARR